MAPRAMNSDACVEGGQRKPKGRRRRERDQAIIDPFKTARGPLTDDGTCFLPPGSEYEAAELAKSRTNKLRRRKDALGAAKAATDALAVLPAKGNLREALCESGLRAAEEQEDVEAARELGRAAPGEAADRWAGKGRAGGALLLAAAEALGEQLPEEERDLALARVVLQCLAAGNWEGAGEACSGLGKTALGRGVALLAEACANGWTAAAKKALEAYGPSLRRDQDLYDLALLAIRRLPFA